MPPEPPRSTDRTPAGPALRTASLPVLLGLAVAVAAGCGPADTGGQEDESATDAAATDSAQAAAGATADDSAAYWRDRLMEALGGQEAWESTRYLAFDWMVGRGDGTLARSHRWDRYTGRYRLEFPQEDAGRFLALFNVNEIRRDSALGKVPEGRVWIGDRELEGAARDSALSRAFGIFINDSYWLLMPYKWADPGVHASYEGRTELESVEGGPFPTVRLTFDEGLGVTNDRYWGYVDPETGLMAAWQYHLQGRDEKGAVIRWQGWKKVGPIRLATDRIWPDGTRNLWFEELEASRSVPEGAFDGPGS